MGGLGPVDKHTNTVVEDVSPVFNQERAATANQAAPLDALKHVEASGHLDWPRGTDSADRSSGALLRKILRELRENGIAQRDIDNKSAMLAQLEKVATMKKAASFKIGPLVMGALQAALAAGQGIMGAVTGPKVDPLAKVAGPVSTGASVVKHSNTALGAVTPVINGAVQYHGELAQAQVQEEEYSATSTQRRADKSAEYVRDLERSWQESVELLKEAAKIELSGYQAAGRI
ncbi:YopD family type III secretion system translocon subunit [Pseudomonas plecoglossicida]|uniref:YopD family type III secretion system translocon subunit n=1 Tax=Pseudomonas plecoglossicida TaxID=70775 RepID=UPI00048B7250|nr:YopD family type III secretion system translocon subunit [Pseudomonas plecoglossicida]GLR37890.1 hypothetical protein GCM10011247_32880 [Pseudomonas plecoglossicida]